MNTHLTVKQLPESERPYEKAFEKGIESLSDAELLAVILRTGTKKLRSIDLAYAVLNHKKEYPGLLGLYYTTKEDLMKINGIGRVKALELEACAELAKRLAKLKRKQRFSVRSPRSIAEYYMEQLRHEKREKTLLLLLDGKNRIIREHMISEGTVNLSMASSREIFIEALKYEAVYIILIHNHPSGDPTPSMQDLKSTKMIKKAGDFMEIPLLVHIIIGDCSYVSLREQNLF